MWGDNARSRTQFREPLAKAVAPRDGTKSRLRAWAMPLGAAPTKTPAGGRSRGPISVQGGAYGRPQQETPSRKSAMTETNTTAAQGLKDSNAKVIEFARANSNAAFDYASKLLGVKSPSEFIEVSTEQAR